MLKSILLLNFCVIESCGGKKGLKPKFAEIERNFFNLNTFRRNKDPGLQEIKEIILWRHACFYILTYKNKDEGYEMKWHLIFSFILRKRMKKRASVEC